MKADKLLFELNENAFDQFVEQLETELEDNPEAMELLSKKRRWEKSA